MCISLVINKLQYDARYLQRQITISIISAATFLSSLAICGFCRECSVFLETEEKLWRVSVKECKASDLCARRISWNVFRVFRTKKKSVLWVEFFFKFNLPVQGSNLRRCSFLGLTLSVWHHNLCQPFQSSQYITDLCLCSRIVLSWQPVFGSGAIRSSQ